MTKEEATRYLQQLYPNGGHCWLDEQRIEAIGMAVRLLQEEPVSELLNAESMIESYKQRLISQANGMKNSLLVDMCLASYKHGINDTLDTLNLSNVERTVKNWKEPVSEEWIEELRTKLDSMSKEEFEKVWKKYETEEKEEPVSEDLEEAVNAYIGYAPEVDESSSTYGKRQAFKAGAKWQKEQMMEKGIETTFNVSLPSGLYDKLWVKGCKEGDKLLVIKKDEL